MAISAPTLADFGPLTKSLLSRGQAFIVSQEASNFSCGDIKPALCLDKLVTQRLFNRRDRIPPRTDVLWRISRGAVCTFTWNSEGRLITLGYWGPGDVVGHPLSRIKPYEIECLTSVEVSILPEALWCQALDAIVLHIQQSQELLSIVHHNPVRQRLWQLLVWLGQKFGREVDTGRLIDLEVTHQEIAETINTTRVSVTRLIQQFESEGMLRRHQRRLILCLGSSKDEVIFTV